MGKLRPRERSQDEDTGLCPLFPATCAFDCRSRMGGKVQVLLVSPHQHLPFSAPLSGTELTSLGNQMGSAAGLGAGLVTSVGGTGGVPQVSVGTRAHTPHSAFFYSFTLREG